MNTPITFGPTQGQTSFISPIVQSIVNTTSSSAWKYVFYGLILGIIIAVVLLVSDAFFPFLPSNPISGPSSAARTGKTFWKTLPPDAENLIVPANDSPTKQAGTYTMSFQMIIGDSRTASKKKYRHVVHRGSNPCGISAATSGVSGHSGIKPTDIPKSAESTYISDGLPSVMNPGLFLDQYKNDLHVMVHTVSDKSSMMLESMTIPDLPLNAPLAVSIVCNGSIVEVYLNCRLYSTMMLKGKPYLPGIYNQWFGRYCAYPFTGLVKNLQLWDVALTSDDLIAMCKKGGFDGDVVPQGCPATA